MAAEKKQDKRAGSEVASTTAKKAKVETAPTRRSARSASVSESAPPKAAKKAEPKAKQPTKDTKKKVESKVEPKAATKKAEPKKEKVVKKAEPKKEKVAVKKADAPAKKEAEKKVEPKTATKKAAVAKKESPKKAVVAKNESPKKAATKESKVSPKKPAAALPKKEVTAAVAEKEPKKESPKKVAKKAEKPKKESPKKETKATSTEKVIQGKQLPPGFVIKAEDETMVDLNELTKTSGFVIFFYPKANTPGCTKQACGFRDNYQQITKAGYQVFGMSADNPGPQASWKIKNSFPYKLLCDPEGKHLKQFGVFKEPKSVTRSHIIVAKGGMVTQVKIQISPLDSVNEALAFVLKK